MISMDVSTGEVTEVPDNVPMIDNNVFLAEEIRSRRNALLRDSDWTQGSDSPVSAAAILVWKNYRQALRDITKQTTFPRSVIWPTPPL